LKSLSFARDVIFKNLNFVFSSSLLSEQVVMVVVRAVLGLFLGSAPPSPLLHPPGTAAPPPNLAEGVYQLGSAHNFDAYLAELGVNLLLRRLANMVTPTVTVSRFIYDVHKYLRI